MIYIANKDVYLMLVTFKNILHSSGHSILLNERRCISNDKGY
jgi:hypothetical protein